MDSENEPVDELIAGSLSGWLDLLARMFRRAILLATVRDPDLSRLSWGMQLLSPEQLYELTERFIAINFTSMMLGRAAMRLEAEDESPELKTVDNARYGASVSLNILNGSVRRSLRPVKPTVAIEFFAKLVPSLRRDTHRMMPFLEREAFTLALATSDKVLADVKAVIQRKLETGKEVGKGIGEINRILQEAGVTPPNGYGELVLRTNMMEAYRNGRQREFLDPDLDRYFPVWRYLGIADGRQRMGPAPKPDHNIHFNKYYRREVLFVQVRGTEAKDTINCRCGQQPIYKGKWARRQAAGAVLEVWP